MLVNLVWKLSTISNFVLSVVRHVSLTKPKVFCEALLIDATMTIILIARMKDSRS